MTVDRVAELVALVLAAVEDRPQVLGGPQHVGVGEVERREAQAHDVGLAEVADDPAGDEGLHHGIRLGVPHAHLRAPALGLAGRRDLEVGRQGVEALEEEAGQRERPLAGVGHVDAVVGRRAQPPARACRAAAGCRPAARAMPGAGT